MATLNELADAAREAAEAAETKYQSLSPIDQVDAKAKRDEVLDNWALAEVKILQSTRLITDQDLKDMKALKDEIDQAADTQQLIVALGRLAISLAKFV